MAMYGSAEGADLPDDHEVPSAAETDAQGLQRGRGRDDACCCQRVRRD